jgi:hypothetical protein
MQVFLCYLRLQETKRLKPKNQYLVRSENPFGSANAQLNSAAGSLYEQTKVRNYGVPKTHWHLPGNF